MKVAILSAVLRPGAFGVAQPSILVALAFVAVLGAQPASADRVEDASTGRNARRDAERAIPLALLAPDDQARVRYVLENTSLYRRLPTERIDCDPHLFLFLLQNPDVVVKVWQAIGISRVSLERAAPNMFRGEDGQGTECLIKVLRQSPEMTLLYAEGGYNGKLLSKPVEARCVLLLRSTYHREKNGRYYVTCTFDTFVHLERGGLEIVAKALQPLIGRSADVNFAESLAFVSSLSRTAEINPAAMDRIAQRLDGVDENVRDRLSLLSSEVAERSVRSAELQHAEYQRLMEARQPRRR